MLELNYPFRKATKGDADAMAQLVNMAGEGLPYYLWDQMAAQSETAWEVGRQRAQREEGGFSYRNTIVREDTNKIASCLIGYSLPERPNPDVYNDMPAMFVPLQQLEDLACNSWYINVLATFPEYQGKGYGAELIELAKTISQSMNLDGVSIIVSDANEVAYRLYKKLGFTEKAQRLMVKETWVNAGKNWLLLTDQ